MCRYNNTSADLSHLHTLCRTFNHRVEALGATVLSSSSAGLGCTAMAEVTHTTLQCDSSSNSNF